MVRSSVVIENSCSLVVNLVTKLKLRTIFYKTPVAI